MKTRFRGLAYAGLASFALSGCASSYDHVPADWRPPQPPAATPTGPPAEVWLPIQLDRFRGRTAGDGQRVERIIALGQAVLNSAEFRCQLLSFDYGHPRWPSAGSPACVDDGARRLATGDNNGFNAESYCPSVCGSADPLLQRHSASYVPSSAVVRILLNARELGREGPDGAETADAELHVVNMDIRLCSNIFQCSHLLHPWIGNTNPCGGYTVTKRSTVDTFTDYELVGHWLHEYTHRIGFCDSGKTAESPGLVSYALGYFACIEAGRLSHVPKERYLEDCSDTMHGNGE